MFGYYFDPTYILVIIGVIISLIASGLVKSSFAKYAKIKSRGGYTGAQAAERILHDAGIYDVSVQHISGNLTDHYDPSNKILRLSDTVYGSDSVAAIGVAAHECGHAIQHAKEYAPLKIRGAMVPVVNFGATISWPLILIGFFISGGSSILVQIGIVLFSLVVLFQLVTLPVEFNASGRAVAILANTGILYEEELSSAKKVLRAAAMTYVAAAAASVLNLVRLLLLSGGRNRD